MAPKAKPPVTAADVRVWALRQARFAGQVPARGRLTKAVIDAYNKRHPTRQYDPVARSTAA